jgi:hypothetical protein
MSRVEPKEPRDRQRLAEHGRNPADQRDDSHPSQAEGDERDVDEALKRQERFERSR